MRYDFSQIEAKWQAFWAEQGTFAAPNPGDDNFDPDKPKYYVLDMFPYPSGVGLHVGHPLGYIATDIVARYQRMRGFNVLHPMGFDAFGLPAEQFAVEHGVHPAITTQKNIDNMVRQLKRLGLSYDWDRCVSTTDVDYYKWTQWIFLQMYNSWFDEGGGTARPISQLEQLLASESGYVDFDGSLVIADTEGLDALAGTPIGTRKWHELDADQQRAFLDGYRLAYMDEVPVNWCPALGTVLANEEVTNDGRSERGNHPVFKRPLKQWMLRITAYAERLLGDLDMVDWPEPIKLMQRNWIGRSEGAMVDFAVASPGDDPEESTGDVIQVYTTRPDTLFGATYMVLAPEHELVDELTTPAQQDAVRDYRHQAESRSDVDRMAETKTKTGVFTGGFAINPVNDQPVPIWIADYVLMGYGTGAIMAVPAHDERDFEFAKQFGLPIQDVVYTPALAAVAAFCDHVENKDVNEDRCFDTLVDFVAYCVSHSVEDYDAAFDVILNRRRPRDDDFGAGNNRGAIRSIWEETLEPFRASGMAALVQAGREGHLISLMEGAVAEPGVNVHSANDEISIDGLHTPDAKKKITDWIDENGLGSFQVQYKLRDWLFSRQRYWGEPFPVVHTPDGAVVPLGDADLPVALPEMEDFKPSASDDPNAPPLPPLGRAPDDWRTIDIEGIPHARELNTMPQWAGSCWYYLRFIDPKNSEQFVGDDAEEYWMKPSSGSKDSGEGRGLTPPACGGIDLYVGGAEHAVLHLLYARFWHKVLFDLDKVSTAEPFGRLFNQGYIQAYCYRDLRGIAVPAEEVEKREEPVDVEYGGRMVNTRFFYNDEPVIEEYGKMGKGLKNAVSPDEMCEKYGCDSLRLYEMYLGPLDQSKPWRTEDIVGVYRFLQRLWRNYVNEDTDALKVTDEAPEALQRKLHKTIKRVTDDMERMSFNTAVAALIELNNELVALKTIPREIAQAMVLLIAPLAPHVAEELWSRLGHEQSLAHTPWPVYDEALLVEDTIEFPVQVNGKVRGRVSVPADADDKTIEEIALATENVKVHTDGKTVRKVIVIKGRMINIVAN